MRTFLTLVGLALSLVTSAQTTYGLRQGIIPWQEGLFLGGYDVLSNTWVFGDTLEYAEGFALGSSTYDQWNDAYVFMGAPIGFGPLQWMSQTIDGPHTLATLTGNLHSIHHDMQNGSFYGLEGYALDSVFVDLGGGVGYWDTMNWGTRCVKIDASSGTVERTTVVEMPWLEGVVAGASCYDSDLHRFFIWGINNLGQGRLITIDCAESSVLANVQIATAANLSEFEFNIADSTLIGLRAFTDAAGNADMDLVSVDPMTGTLTPQLDLPQVGSYTPDGTVFDQLNGLYVMHYYQGIGLNSRILAVDAATWEVVADHALDGSFLELEMSNANFATLRYGTVDVAEAAPEGVRLEGGRWVNCGEGPLWVAQIDGNGRLIADGIWLAPGASLEVGSGWNVWSFTSPEGVRFTRKTFRP